MTSHLSMLQRFRARMVHLLTSTEDLVLKRARSDADLTLIVLELASSLSEEEQALVQEITTMHNQLWDARVSSFQLDPQIFSSLKDEMQPEQVELPVLRYQNDFQTLMRWYSDRMNRYAWQPGTYRACKQIVRALSAYKDIPEAVEVVQRSVISLIVGQLMKQYDTPEASARVTQELEEYERFLRHYMGDEAYEEFIEHYSIGA